MHVNYLCLDDLLFTLQYHAVPFILVFTVFFQTTHVQSATKGRRGCCWPELNKMNPARTRFSLQDTTCVHQQTRPNHHKTRHDPIIALCL